MRKYIIQAVILWGTVGLLWFLFVYDNVDNSKEKYYQDKIDSLQIEIGLNKNKIDSLTAAKVVLDSLIAIDKNKLADIAKKAKEYKDKYNEEHNRISDMSDDDIIREFTAAFQ